MCLTLTHISGGYAVCSATNPYELQPILKSLPNRYNLKMNDHHTKQKLDGNLVTDGRQKERAK